jgi:hypothetical protein
MRTISISDAPLALADLREVWEGPVQVVVAENARQLIRKSQMS